MQILLERIRWKCFLSTGNHWTEINLTDAKTTLIVGKNGSGKSTFLDALSFVLFGRPFRKIRKSQLVNSIINKDCIVEIYFTINKHKFKVIRGIKPDIFEIFKNSELLNQTADNRDYQDAFEQYILKTNHKTFCQIVILGSAIFTPFMVLPTTQRRGVIEDILDLDIFTKMNMVLSKKVIDCEKDLKEIVNKKDLADQKLQLTEKHIKAVQESKDEVIKTNQDKLEEIVRQLNDIADEINDFKIQIAGLSKLLVVADSVRAKQLKFIALQSQLSHKTETLNKEIAFLTNNEVCPTCHQNIDAKFKEQTIEERTKHSEDLEKGLAELKIKLDEINQNIEAINKTQKDKNNLENLVYAKTAEQRGLERNKTETTSEIDRLQEQTGDVDFSKLEEIKNEIGGITKVIDGLSDNKTIMGYASALLKDSGIKAKIVKTFIPVINQLIQKYLADLDFFVEFYLNEEFQETLKSRHRDTFSFESFSEGEKMRLNLAILFTWRAIARLRSSININICIFDELFDGSLDTEGISDIIRVIGNLTDDNIFIISHREDQIPDKFNKIIRFTKIKNFSRAEVL